MLHRVRYHEVYVRSTVIEPGDNLREMRVQKGGGNIKSSKANPEECVLICVSIQNWKTAKQYGLKSGGQRF